MKLLVYMKDTVSKLVFADDVNIFVWITMLGFTVVFTSIRASKMTTTTTMMTTTMMMMM